jgi:hypothetical protein
MPAKKHKSEEIMMGQGGTIVGAGRRIPVSEQTPVFVVAGSTIAGARSVVA